MPRSKNLDKNVAAFLDMIAVSEIGAPLLAASDDGYNVIVGSTAEHPDLFASYADHPRKLVELRPGLKSTAAGRYQLLSRYFEAYRAQLHLPDFSPESQDAIAVQQIKECHALPEIMAGRLEHAVSLCAHIWASLPGAGYGQHENLFEKLSAAFTQAGGEIAIP